MGTSDASESERQLNEVLRIVGQLPELQRQVITLRKVYGYEASEIAARLNITEQQVEEEVAKAVRYVAERVT